jgi:hypothetical protein
MRVKTKDPWSRAPRGRPGLVRSARARPAGAGQPAGAGTLPPLPLDLVVDAQRAHRERHRGHQPEDEQHQQQRLHAHRRDQHVAERRAPTFLSAPPSHCPREEQHGQEGQHAGGEEHPGPEIPEQDREQIRQVAGEGEGVEAHQHHRTEAVEARQLVHQEQRRDQDQEDDRGEPRSAITQVRM